jgi:hypothetical protein
MKGLAMIYIPYSNTHQPSGSSKNTMHSANDTMPLASMRTFIAQSISLHDTNKDGEISLDEAIKGPGLTGEKKNTYTAEDAKALWASISGPTGTLSARDYAQYLLYLDKDANGELTEQEVSEQKQTLINNTKTDIVRGVVQNYTQLIHIAMQKGLDVELPKGDEQHFALQYAAGLNRPGDPVRETAQSTGYINPMSSTLSSMMQPIASSNAHELTTQQYLNLMIDIGRIGNLSTLPPRTAHYASSQNTGNAYAASPRSERMQSSDMPTNTQTYEREDMLKLLLTLLVGLYHNNEGV